MTEYTAKRNAKRCPTHPGAVLQDVLPAVKRPKTEYSCTRNFVSAVECDLKRKKAISPASPCALESCSATGCGFGCKDYKHGRAERKSPRKYQPLKRPDTFGFG